MTWLQELNLSNNQLAHLSPLVACLPDVRVINISNNRLGGIPSEIGQLTNLRSLDVRGNNIRQLPLELGFCAELRELKIDEAMVIVPSAVVMSLEVRAIMIYLRRLHEANKTGKLYLTGMGLANVPKEVWHMTELTEIGLDKNLVNEIDHEIIHFDYLEIFCCGINKIENFDFLLGDPRSPPWNRLVSNSKKETFEDPIFRDLDPQP
jgi:leucine-rich repeat protein SHOC2